MKNVYDNAGHLERLGALARENEDLKRRLAELEKQEPVNQRVRLALADLVALMGEEVLEQGTCGYFDVEVKPADVVAFREARDALLSAIVEGADNG